MLATRRLGFIAARQCIARRTFASLPPHVVVPMPALSPTMETGNVSKWSKKVGDAIAAGDVICLVETDKAVVDFEAQEEGFLAKILVDAGTQANVGDAICITVEDESAVSAFAGYKVAAAPAAAPEPPKASPPPPPTKAVETPKAQPPPPVVQKEAPAPVAAAAPAPAPKKAPAPSPPASSGSPLIWGHGVLRSPLYYKMTTDQKAYVKKYGSTLQDIV